MQITHLIKQNKCLNVDWREVEDEVQFHEALLAWSSKEHDVAKFLMKNLNRKLESDKENENQTRPTLLPEVLRTLGSWMFELKSDSSALILEKYLKRSVKLYDELSRINSKSFNEYVNGYPSTDAKKRIQAYASLATFCDEQYKHIVNYSVHRDF